MASTERDTEAKAVILGVIGFDEKYHIRCAMRVFSRWGLERVVYLRPEPAGRAEAERSDAALASLSRLVKEYMEAAVEVHEVGAGDFARAFTLSRRLVEEALRAGRRVVVCLSGGMRYLNAALLAAALSLPRDTTGLDNVTIEADLESGQGHVEVPLKPLKALAALTGREQAVLEALWRLGTAGPTEVSEQTGYSKSTVWKILDTLVKAGLAEKLDGGKYRPLFPG